MFTRLCTVARIIVVFLVVQTTVWAQNTSSFGSQSIGSGTTGTTQTTQGSSDFGQSVNTNSGTGTNNPNSSTAGADFSSSSLGAQMMSRMEGLGFVSGGNSNNANSVLGGIGSSDSGSSNQSTNTNSSLSNLNQNPNTFQKNSTIDTSATRYGGDSRPTKLDLPPLPSPDTVTRNLTNRINVALNRSGNQAITVIMDGQTATLKGTVSSAREKRSVEMLARMERGVGKVRNELEVVGSLETPSRSP
jgi:osmotically-inducible protein OsmY